MSRSAKKSPKFMSTTVLYRRLLKYVRPYWGWLFIAILGNVAFSGIDAASAYILKPLINRGFIAREVQFIQWFPYLVLIAFILRGGANALGDYAMTYTARSVIMRLRQDLFSHLLKLPASFYDNTSSGKLLAKILYDVEQMAQLSTDALTNFVQSGVLVVGLLMVMAIISWRLTLLYLTLIPIIAMIVRFTNRRIRSVSNKVQAAVGDMTEVAEESIEAYKVVRLFNGEDYQKEKFNKATIRGRDKDVKMVVSKSLNVSGVQIVAACGISFIIYLAINPHYATILSAGSFASMMVAMLAILKPLKNLSTINSLMQRGLAGAESIFKLLDELTEIDKGKMALPVCQGYIHYQNVNFSYQANQTPILQDINFTIVPGQTVALVGRSGSGKTTIASLLARFYEVNQGHILLDKIDIREIPLSQLRSHIAFVSQQVALFNDTVFNNIAYGMLETVSKEEVITAAKRAYAWEFIEKFPQGLDTLIGENGVLLSGGQRQRIALARAILKNAAILILDEATSALDSESEHYIHVALENIRHQRTTLIIAHRLSTIEKADLILVLVHGKIVERGTHSELLELNGYYARLVKQHHQVNQAHSDVILA